MNKLLNYAASICFNFPSNFDYYFLPLHNFSNIIIISIKNNWVKYYLKICRLFYFTKTSIFFFNDWLWFNWFLNRCDCNSINSLVFHRYFFIFWCFVRQVEDKNKMKRIYNLYFNKTNVWSKSFFFWIANYKSLELIFGLFLISLEYLNNLNFMFYSWVFNICLTDCIGKWRNGISFLLLE